MTTTVATTTDPSIRIDLALPWQPAADRIGPREVIQQELASLAEEFKTREAPSRLMDSFREFLPDQRPAEVNIGWEAHELDLESDARAIIEVPIYSVGTNPFALCFIASDLSTGDATSSEVVVLWRDRVGAVNLAFNEG